MRTNRITYDDVKPLIVDVVGTDIINPDKDTFSVLGMDSVDVLDLTIQIEKEFDISLLDAKVNSSWTISQYLNHINTIRK